MTDLDDLMAAAIDQENLNTTDLERVAAVARKQYRLQVELEKAEQELEDAKKRLNAVRDKELPDMMMEIGMSEFKLDNGFRITVKDEVYCSLPEDPEPAFEWLRENSFEAIIKNFVQVAFGKGDDETAKKAIETLIDLGLRPEVKTSIHPSTLKAFIKEQMSKGVEVPLEKFGAFCVARSKIEIPKPLKVRT